MAKQRKSVRKTKKRAKLDKSFIDAATDLFALLDSNLNILEVNAAVFKTSGMTRRAIIGKNLTAFFPDLASSDRLEKYQQVIETGQPFQVDNVLLNTPVGGRYASIKAFRVDDGLGLTATDITQRVISERSLERERRLFHCIADNAIQNLELPELCQNILNELTITLGFDFGVIQLVQKNQESLLPIAISGMSKNLIADKIQICLVDDPNLIGAYVFRSRLPIFAPDIQKHSIYTTHSDRIDALGIGSLVSWPVSTSDNQVIGIIQLAGSKPREINEKDRILYNSVANMCTAMISRKRAEQAVVKEKEYFHSFVESLSDWAWELDANGVHTYSNQAVKNMLGYSVHEVVGYPLPKLWSNGTTPEKVKEHLDSLLRSRKGWKNFIGLFKHKNGSTVYTESTAIPIFDEHNTLIGFKGLDRDVTKRKTAEDALRLSAQKIEILHETARRFAACTSLDEVYLETVNAAEHLFDLSLSMFALYENDQFVIKAISSGAAIPDFNFGLLHEIAAKDSLTNQKTIRQTNPVNPKIEGIEIFHSMISSPIGEEGVFQAFSVEPDVFFENDARILKLLLGHSLEALNRLRLQKKLQMQATHDPLTSIYNRYYLSEALNREVKRAKRCKTPIAFLMIDVDRFKEINDRFGHQIGDSVLITVAAALQNSIRETDIVVRYGGDEFLVILPESQTNCDNVIARIENEISEFNRTTDQLSFPLSLSIGSAVWKPDGNQSVEDIRNLADRRMYEVKARQHTR